MSVPGSHPALFWPGATVSKSVSLIFEGPYESQRKFIPSREGALLWVILSYLQTEAAAEGTQVWLTFCSAPFCVTHFRRGHRQIRNFSSGVCVTCQRDEPSGRIRKVEVGLQSLPHTHTQSQSHCHVTTPHLSNTHLCILCSQTWWRWSYRNVSGLKLWIKDFNIRAPGDWVFFHLDSLLLLWEIFGGLINKWKRIEKQYWNNKYIKTIKIN